MSYLGTLLIKTALRPGEIKKLREKHFLDRDTLAHHIGADPKQISLWERGKKKPGQTFTKRMKEVDRFGTFKSYTIRKNLRKIMKVLPVAFRVR